MNANQRVKPGGLEGLSRRDLRLDLRSSLVDSCCDRGTGVSGMENRADGGKEGYRRKHTGEGT